MTRMCFLIFRGQWGGGGGWEPGDTGAGSSDPCPPATPLLCTMQNFTPEEQLFWRT